MAANLSNLCMESARVLLSSSMMRLGACKLPYWSWSGWPWLWWRLDRAASWEGSKVPWWMGIPWGGPHFWGRAQRGFGDGEGEPSCPPGGTQIITFLGGRGGECFPPGMQGNFIGWQESRKKKKKRCIEHLPWVKLLNRIHNTLLVQTDKQSSWTIRHGSDVSAERWELGQGNATFLWLTDWQWQREPSWPDCRGI